MPYYFLIGQSIELSFKAFLLGRGEKLTELKRRKFGHNLSALSKEARRRKLGLVVQLKPVHFGAIDVLSIEYASRRYQYIRTGTMYLPEVSLVQEAADRLSEDLRGFVENLL